MHVVRIFVYNNDIRVIESGVNILTGEIINCIRFVMPK